MSCLLTQPAEPTVTAKHERDNESDNVQLAKLYVDSKLISMWGSTVTC
jgi:hypothetical protein